MSRFGDVYRRSLEQPEEFWAEAAEAIDWVEPWKRVLDDSRAPGYRWFSGGRLNTCYNALDRHVERGRAEQAALVYDSPVTGTAQTFSYPELGGDGAGVAFPRRGVGGGCRLLFTVPVARGGVVAMPAGPGRGGIHSVVFGGFA